MEFADAVGLRLFVHVGIETLGESADDGFTADEVVMAGLIWHVRNGLKA